MHKKAFFVFTILFIIGVIGMIMYKKMNTGSVQEEKIVELVEYFENELLFEFSEYVSLVKGESYEYDYGCGIEKSSAMIIKVNKGAEEKFINLLEVNCSKHDFSLPPTSSCSLVTNFKDKEIKETYYKTVAWTYAKSKTIIIFVGYQGDEIYAFLYE